MNQDKRRCIELEGAADDLPGKDRRVIDCARRLHLIGNQKVFLVEKQNAEFLAIEEGRGRAAIIEHGAETAHRRPISTFTLAKRLAASATIFNSTIAASPRPAISRKRSGRNNTGEGPEARQQRLGERLHVAPRDRAK